MEINIKITNKSVNYKKDWKMWKIQILRLVIIFKSLDNWSTTILIKDYLLIDGKFLMDLWSSKNKRYTCIITIIYEKTIIKWC